MIKGGTAGQPILGGIESEGVSEVMVVVTRYSGGIKLGTGGLCRAYGGASRLCLQAAERCGVMSSVTVCVCFFFYFQIIEKKFQVFWLWWVGEVYCFFLGSIYEHSCS